MQVRCTVQLEASFAAAAVGAIILQPLHDDARGGRPHALNTHATTLILKYVAHHNHCRGWFEYDTDRSREWGAPMCAAAASK